MRVEEHREAKIEGAGTAQNETAIRQAGGAAAQLGQARRKGKTASLRLVALPAS